MTIYLSAEHVRKSYDTKLALKDVSLEVYQGEILALLGPNGAGKTTLIKILATLLTKDQGRVQILGYDLDKDQEKIQLTMNHQFALKTIGECKKSFRKF